MPVVAVPERETMVRLGSPVSALRCVLQGWLSTYSAYGNGYVVTLKFPAPVSVGDLMWTLSYIDGPF